VDLPMGSRLTFALLFGLLGICIAFEIRRDNVFNVVEYGAKGDGTTVDTLAIQKALNACESSGGGIVLFPKTTKSVFLTGSLWLASNMLVRISEGVTVKGVFEDWNSTWNDYPSTYSRGNGQMKFVHAAIFNAARCLRLSSTPKALGDQCAQWKKLENLTIEGPGIIDGSGQTWWKCKYISSGICPDGSEYGSDRPTTLGLLWVRNLTIQNLEIRNSPFWTIHVAFSKFIVVRNVSVFTPSSHAPTNISSHETDGVHLDSSQSAVISNCLIDTGDDNVALSSGKDADGRAVNISCSDILVENCRFLKGHGASIGSGTSGNITNVVFRNIFFNGTDNGVRMKTVRGRGGVVSNITYEGLEMHNIGLESPPQGNVIYIDMYYEGNPPPTNASATPHFHDIFVKKIVAHDSLRAGNVSGLSDAFIQRLHISDIHASTKFGFYCMFLANTTWSHVVPQPPKTCFQ